MLAKHLTTWRSGQVVRELVLELECPSKNIFFWGSAGGRWVCTFLSSLYKHYCCRYLGQLERSTVNLAICKKTPHNFFVSNGKFEAWLPMDLYPKVKLLWVSFCIQKWWPNFLACLPVKALRSFHFSSILLHFTKFTEILTHLWASSQLNLNWWKCTEIVGEQRVRKLTKQD